MAFCSNCGVRLSDGTRFCQNCGYPVETSDINWNAGMPEIKDNPYGWNAEETQGTFNYTGVSGVQNNPYNRNSKENPQTPVYGNYNVPAQESRPMNWFKFVIYVQLFLGALVNVGQAIRIVAVVAYQSGENSQAWIYFYYPSLKAVDCIYAFCLLGMAAAAIAVRMMLAKYKNGAPTMYFIYLIGIRCIDLVYSLIVCAICDDFSLLATQIPYIIVTVVLVWTNIIYFSKRSHLFVN